MAEGLFKKMIAEHGKTDDIKVISAGISSGFGPAQSHATEVMRELGIDISPHRAKQFTAKMADGTDLIITMDKYVKDTIIEDFPGAEKMVYTLKEFAFGKVRDDDDFDIEDPFGGPIETFRKCAEEIAEVLEVAWDKIKT